MNIFLLISGVLSITTISPTSLCTCPTLYNENDCLNKLCYWADSKCQDPPTTYKTYCEYYNQSTCSKTTGCAYYDSKCVTFTGCSAYVATTNALCTAISSKCISDGTTCISQGECSSYKTSTSCITDWSNMNCYWDSEKSLCSLPSECIQLPKTFKTDAECRAQLSFCTTTTDGGCVKSGDKCSDQIIEDACKYNLDKSQQCFWNNSQCYDLTCANAPSSNTTDDLCKAYLASCTVSQTGSGCVTRPNTCTEMSIQNQCVTNAAGDQCFWINEKCVSKSCSTAGSEYKTDAKCKEYLSTCTVNQDLNGCMDRATLCMAYSNEEQCKLNSSGGVCFWNNSKCADKNCANAVSTLTTHAQCNSFLSTCTVAASGSGCESIQDKCESYKVALQCVQRTDGQLCIYQDNQCIDRICSNASLTLTSEGDCQAFSTTCTLSSTKKGCTVKTCQSQLTSDTCQTDYQNNSCVFTQVCQVRTCENASSSMKSDSDCRTYLSSCTLAEIGYGCVTRAATCDAITVEAQCIALTGNTQKCSWNLTEKKCRNINCLDASVTLNTDAGCQSYYSECTVNSTLSGCQTRPDACAGLLQNQCNEVTLSDKSKCSWNQTVCRARNCDDAPETIKSTTDCRTYLSSCILKNTNSGCQTEPTTCSGFTTSSECNEIKSLSIKCGWNGCENRSCLNAPAVTDNSYTHLTCNSYLTGCTVNQSGNGCMSQMESCNGLDSTQCGKVVLSTGSTCFWATNDSPPACRLSKCSDVNPVSMTHDKCQEFSKACTLGPQSAGCVDQLSSCTGLDELQCKGTVLIGGGHCSWGPASSPTCRARQCEDAAVADYKTHDACKAFLSTCTLASLSGGCMQQQSTCATLTQTQCLASVLVNGSYCSWGGSPTASCRARVCADAPEATYIKESDCRTFLSTCTIQTDESGCMDEPAGCNLMSKVQCTKHSVQGQCFWNESANPASCRQAVCTDASLSFTTSAECSAYISTCTVAKTTGCIAKPQICTGITQEHCSKVVLTSGGQCSYSGTKCQDRTCADAPSTITTEANCRSWMKTCTIQLDGTGCVDEGATCALLQSQEQCTILSGGAKCGWNQGCVGRVCSNAPATYITDAQCRAYLPECTVQEDGTGCVIRGTTCGAMVTEKQCGQLSDLSKYCQWNTTSLKCEDRTCPNAPSSYTTYSQCNTHLSSCTLSQTGNGCVTKFTLCTQYTTSQQCVLTVSNTKCQWIKSESKCTDIVSQCSSYVTENTCTLITSGGTCIWISGICYQRTCDNAPKSYSTHEQCNTYLTGCTTSGKGCISYNVCSNYIQTACVQGTDGACTKINQCNIKQCLLAPITYTTDQECTAFKSTCTTNGAGCIDRKRCQDAYIEQACVKDYLNQECAWQSSQCLTKTCETAPVNITNEAGCESYFPSNSCTAKSGGGCTIKKRCSDATIQQACTTARDGTQCKWMNEQCQDKSCQDYIGPTHDICNGFDSRCTTAGFRCTTITSCAATPIKLACVVGLDGPCIWVGNKCQKFAQCSDILLKTHDECSQYSTQCTTNGLNCVSISSCAQSNQIQCYFGTDGKCIWTPSTTNKSSSYQCKVFTKCSEAFYLTHEDCYKRSKNVCTSDGINGCIDLSSCTDYTYSTSCVVDKDGPQTTNGKITFSGLCKFVDDKCVKKTCEDLSGTTHEICNSQQSDCTSNGTGCISQVTCASLSLTSCSIAMGTDGKCISEDSKCRVMACSDYPITLCSSYSDQCIQDGAKCVLKGECTSYSTQSACDQGGSTDVCAWIVQSNSKGKCVAVTECAIATAYQKACTTLSNKCSWISTTTLGVTTSSCKTKTCDNQSGSCGGFYSWDGKTYTLCAFDNSGKCVEKDPTELLITNCYSLTLGTYSWDQNNSKCVACPGSTSTDNNTTTNSTNTTGTTQIYSQILKVIMTLIIMIYL